MKIYGGNKRFRRQLVVAGIENAIALGVCYGALRLTGAVLTLLGVN